MPVPRAPLVGEAKQKIYCWLEFLLLATSISKLVRTLRAYSPRTKNRMHDVRVRELGCEQIRVACPSLSPRCTRLRYGSVKDGSKLRCRCYLMGIGGHNV